MNPTPLPMIGRRRLVPLERKALREGEEPTPRVFIYDPQMRERFTRIFTLGAPGDVALQIDSFDCPPSPPTWVNDVLARNVILLEPARRLALSFASDYLERVTIEVEELQIPSMPWVHQLRVEPIDTPRRPAMVMHFRDPKLLQTGGPLCERRCDDPFTGDIVEFLQLPQPGRGSIGACERCRLILSLKLREQIEAIR